MATEMVARPRIHAYRPEQATAIIGAEGGREGSQDLWAFPIDTGLLGFKLSVAKYRLGDDFFSPRHHHNFDQVRYCLSGTANYGKWDLRAGDCAYYPEAVFYGPQQQKGKGPCELLAMQFTGPCRGYYTDGQEVREAYQALIAKGGVFEHGVYKGRTPEGKPDNKDAAEAVFEQITGRPMEYPDPHYLDAVVMRPPAFSWRPVANVPGLYRKVLGRFTEYETTIALERLAGGASWEPRTEVPELRYVLQGSVLLDGEQYPAGSCFYLPGGLSPVWSSDEGAEMFTVNFPLFAA